MALLQMLAALGEFFVMKKNVFFVFLLAALAVSTASGLPLFTDALEQARTHATGNTWHIQPGRYSAGADGVRLEGVRDVTLLAEGVTLVAENIRGIALRFEDSQNVTVKGLTVDYDPLPFTQGRITAVDKAAGTVDFEVDAGYPDLAGEYLVRRMLLFLPDGNGWKPGAPDFYPSGIEALSLRKGRYTFEPNASSLSWVDVGDKVALNVRRNSAIQVMNKSSAIHWEDCTVYAAPGLAFIVRFAEEAGTFRNVKVVRGPTPAGATEPRLLSSNADAMNIAYTRIGPVVENCEFAWMGDDSINLHGVTLPVLEWVDAQTYLTMRPVGGEMYDWLLRKGDTVRFLKPDEYGEVAVGAVESCVAVDANSAEWMELARKIWPSFREQNKADFYHVKLQEPVRGVAVGDLTTIPQTGAVGYRIENNYFHDHRARALRLMTEEGVVRGNRIERTLGVGISVGSEMHYWRESGYVKNVVIEGNTLKDVAYGANTAGADSYTLGAISIFTQVKPLGKGTIFYPGNENVRITDNRIDGSGVAGIQVVGARDVVIEGNVLERTNQNITARSGQKFGFEVTEPIFVIDSENVRIGDNTTGNAIARPSLNNRLLSAPPQLDAAQVSQLPQEPGEGFRFFRNASQGRDVGQIFSLKQEARIGVLYLPIRSGVSGQNSEAIVQLRIHALEKGRPGRVIAMREGALMPDGSRMRSGSWLQMEFDPIELPRGDYAFVLGFAETGDGNSVVLTLDSAAGKNTGLFTDAAGSDVFRLGKPIAFALGEAAVSSTPVASRVLRVDARGGADFTRLADAAEQARAGDVIEIAPGSGPYREELFIRASGTQEQPIVIEGNGELVTGFEPLTGFVREGDNWVLELGERFPAVLTYRGERLLQANEGGEFTRYARLEADRNNRLVLRSGVEPKDWEISTRYFVVRVENSSWHVYRNLRASGAQNDGFNLHGEGRGLHFENIEGFHNLDEGYSAHDRIASSVDGGLFWGNDNGLFNIGESRFVGQAITCRDNLGWGLAFKDCMAELKGVRLYGNGASELWLTGGARVALSDLEITPSDTRQPPFVRYKESRKQTVYAAEHVAPSAILLRD